MIERAYIEIGNVCNLSCSFCPGTSRKKRQMSREEFAHVCDKIKGFVKYVYLHVMGEPLFHPELGAFLDILSEKKMRACITTNGTLFDRSCGLLLSHSDCVHKVSVSLHSLEGNGKTDVMDNYLRSVADFAKRASDAGIYTVLRLWNEDSAEGLGKNSFNKYIEEKLKSLFDGAWERRRSGYRLMKYVFLEYAGIFTWPTESEAETEVAGRCHGLLDQFAVLADGTVVPCCLDSEGGIPLGNIFEKSLSDILSAPRAVKIRDGFTRGELVEPLCQKCTYARRFK